MPSHHDWQAEYICPITKPPHIERLSRHMDSRKERLNTANNLIQKEKAVLLKSFEVKRPNRKVELHHIYTNGVIEVTDVESELLITVLIGREEQVDRYFEKTSDTCPWLTKAYCQQHTNAGLNYV